MDGSDSDDSSSDSDGFWEELRAENEQYSELDEYMLDIQFTITSLWVCTFLALKTPVLTHLVINFPLLSRTRHTVIEQLKLRASI